jgi:branched-chain amino acid transport system ATP-binding protein
MNSLEVRDIHAGYGKAEVLRGLSFYAMQGTIVSVLGPNGAGKSTLLNAIAGSLGSRGQVVLEGDSLSGLPLEQRALRGLALVPERRELFGSMRVDENLLLGGTRPRNQGKRDWRATLESVYELFPRLKERKSQIASTLSGGERQMLAVGRALMSQPKVLMLDEPSLGLAPLIVADMMAAIAQLKETGLTVILVEQNAHAALGISDRAYVLEGGAFVLEGPADVLRHDPRLVESYLGNRKAVASEETSTGVM